MLLPCAAAMRGALRRYILMLAVVTILILSLDFLTATPRHDVIAAAAAGHARLIFRPLSSAAVVVTLSMSGRLCRRYAPNITVFTQRARAAHAAPR